MSKKASPQHSSTPVTHKPAPESDASPLAQAFAVAERLAQAHLRPWLIQGFGCTEERDNGVSEVYDAIVAARGDQDPQQRLLDVINARITDRDTNIKAADDTTELLVTALDAGYLYGLAFGLAITRGGAR